MVAQTNSNIQSKKERPLAELLGALAYYETGAKPGVTEGPGGVIQFEKLPPEEQKPYVMEAIRFLIRLDKLNKMVINKASMEESKIKEEKNLEILKLIIKGFVDKLKTTRPELFPHEELARRILEGPSAKA